MCYVCLLPIKSEQTVPKATWMLIFLLLTFNTKGDSPLVFSSFETFSDSLKKQQLISSLKFQYELGTDWYLDGNHFHTAILDQFQIEGIGELFTTYGRSLSFGLPDPYSNLSFGFNVTDYFSSPIETTVNSGTRSLDISGNYYGIFLEKSFFLSERIKLHSGGTFLSNTMNVSINQRSTNMTIQQAFNSSKDLKLAYINNLAGMYFSLNYVITIGGIHHLIIGWQFEYKYILPIDIELFNSSPVNQWIISGTSTAINFPYYRNHILKNALTIAFRTNF